MDSGTKEDEDLALGHLEVKVLDRDESVEDLGETARAQNDRHWWSVFLRMRSGSIHTLRR